MTTRYTSDHEYIHAEGRTGTVGISEYAQQQLGDIVFVELPSVGTHLNKGEEAAVVESVKAASEIYAPVSGTVIEINQKLDDAPGLINSDPAKDGWIFKLAIEDEADLEGLMDEAAYADHTA